MNILITTVNLCLKDAPERAASTILATTGPLHLHFAGFDDDPRELWDIPEVRRFFVETAEFEDCGDTDNCMWDRLDKQSYILTGLLLGYWHIVTHGTGNAKVLKDICLHPKKRSGGYIELVSVFSEASAA